jgi:hypothetical protein
MAPERDAARREAIEVGRADDGVARAAQAVAPPLVDGHEEDVESGRFVALGAGHGSTVTRLPKSGIEVCHPTLVS